MNPSRLEAFFSVPTGTEIQATVSAVAYDVSLTAGAYTPTQFCSHIVTMLNVATFKTWTVSVSASTGLATIDCAGETWAITFTTAAAGTVLGFVGNISSRSSAATGTQNVRGYWLPDCPLDLEGDPTRAPTVTDLRTTESPTGGLYGVVGSTRYRHRGLKWSHVSRARTWEGSASPTYSSWEQWFKDTQLGAGHSWFSVSSSFQVYWDNAGSAALVGADLNSGSGPTLGWKLSGLNSIEPRKAGGALLGWWTIEIPQIVSEG